MDRQDLCFSSGADSCAAWLYPAASDADVAPIVVMAHGLSGTRRDGLGAFAERFGAAGIAALVFDHRGFGDSGGEPDLFHPPAAVSQVPFLNLWRQAYRSSLRVSARMLLAAALDSAWIDLYN